MDIPGRWIDMLKSYLEDARRPTDFMMYVLSNDLMRAMGAVNAEDICKIRPLVKFLSSYVPSRYWGSEYVVTDFLARQSKRKHDPLVRTHPKRMITDVLDVIADEQKRGKWKKFLKPKFYGKGPGSVGRY